MFLTAYINFNFIAIVKEHKNSCLFLNYQTYTGQASESIDVTY
jgi:hypothetical protein